MVAVPVSALVWPVRAGSGGDGRSALLVAGTSPIATGEPVVWCTVVVTAPAVVRRDGRVQAQGRPCDHARLGAAEQELDRRCGPGTIDRIAAAVRPTGKKVKAVARREMSVAFTIRAVLLMTVMPDADSREVLTTLLGELTAVPWQRPHAVPSGTVLSTWRTAIGEAPLQQLQRELLAAVGTEHRDPALPRVEVGGGLRLGAIDGTVTRMPDTAANRAAFGTAGQAETGYPQIRHLHVSDALTRATLAVVCWPGRWGQGRDKGEAEQALLDRMLAEQPAGVRPRPVVDHGSELPRRAADRGAAGHRQPRPGPRQVRHPAAPDRPVRRRRVLPDPPVRRRHQPDHAGRRVPRQPGRADHTRAVLPGHRSARPHHPPRAPARAGLPVALGRLGDRPARGQVGHPRRRTRAPGRSCAHTTPELIRQEHAAWITATELVRAATRSAAAIATPFRKGPRTGQPVAARHLSFTTARRTLIATVRAGTATASLPAPARAAAHQRALAVIATARVTTDRHRHRDHKIKTRQPFPHAPRGITTRTAPAHVHVCGTAA